MTYLGSILPHLLLDWDCLLLQSAQAIVSLTTTACPGKLSAPRAVMKPSQERSRGSVRGINKRCETGALFSPITLLIEIPGVQGRDFFWEGSKAIFNAMCLKAESFADEEIGLRQTENKY